MLKALELAGFKSFADKTRFEFPPGITVIVGPNGSGKSNIVDAIKWVLGEQSVKSLRGKEMADVIFNGSGSRRSLNTAEAILTFDNADGRLPIDTSEVHVGRRVYRSGEGEYLINGSACRLRDVRDLFAGTGVSTQAYSIIEQGKVDVMLQASPRDRRLIFEEAAGISRFKAKKLETIRRLDRVEQNLLRLSDIVDEVDSRLRAVRKQAGKAQRYREHANRLQELRTQVGLTDWKHLTETLVEHQQRLDAFTAQIDTNAAKVESLESRGLAIESELSSSEDAIREGDRALAENRGEIAACESTTEHQRSHLFDLEQEIARRQNQVTALTSRTRDLDSQLEATTREVADAREAHEKIAQQVGSLEKSLAGAVDACQQLRAAVDDRRGEQLQGVRQNSDLSNEITSLETRLEAETGTFDRCRAQLGKLEASRRARSRELADLVEAEGVLWERLQESEALWQQIKLKLKEMQDRLGSEQQAVAGLRELRSGLHERATVLEELERQFEGLTAGTKQVILESRQSTSGPFGEVRGLIADILEVQVDVAPLIEIALGEKAGYLLAADGQELRQFLGTEQYVFEGRVGFMAIDSGQRPAASASSKVDLTRYPGVLGRAETFVQAAPEYATFVRQLLHDTWVVRRFTDALELAKKAPGQNFVSRDGGWLGADGSICVGPRTHRTGLISRRSELRDLRKQITELMAKLEQREGVLERLEVEVADASAQFEVAGQQREELQAQRAECRRDRAAAEQRTKQLDEQYETLTGELTRARSGRDGVSSDLALLRDRRAENETQLAELERLVKFDQCRLDELERQRQQSVGEATSAKVNLARSEQSLDNLSARMQQFQQDHHERQRTIDESRNSLAEAEDNARQCEQEILRLAGEAAALYLKNEEFAAQNAELTEAREKLRGERGGLQLELQKLRAQLRKLEAEKHTEDLAAGEIRHQRDSLSERMLEDYGINLEALDHNSDAEQEEQRERIEAEIKELRRKIDNIGNVNLDALEELEGLESRFGNLSAQLDDLTKAKASLEQIIDRINTDSRRLFTETLETVRGHFQVLFRKLFGGGHADIIIEDEADILESGLEIVARPPGTEPRSISLLSGGEKTLTCVACLLAIFRSRPCPFCVLDEVDAALDEANIERFIGVLNEFLEWTQFIVVTHSKKTMACGGTLYGVTMQESGISKRVSVRFEDVSETGEILNTADEDDGTQAA
jgi:chromosome segregation protein